MSTTPEDTSQKAVWVKAPERSNMLMMRIMSWISLRLGRRPGRAVLHLIAVYFVLFSPTSRRASLDYLPRALGRPVTWRDLYHHFFYFAATIHDRIYLVDNQYDLFDIEILGIPHVQPLIDQGN